jgi:HK97 family phage portal protein
MRILGFNIERSTVRNSTIETRDSGTSNLTNPEEWLLQAILGRVASATGITVTPLRMIGIATVFGCVRVRAEAMASLPLLLCQTKPDGSRIEARNLPLFSYMHDAPNKEMSAFDFVGTMEGHLSLRQNAFAEIMRDSDGDVCGLYPIDPMDISMTRDSRTNDLGFRYMRRGIDFKLEDMIHLKGYSRSGIIGIDHSASLQEVFALAIALQDNAAKFFGNGSRPNGVLEAPNALSAEAQKRLKEQFEQSTSGRNAYRTVVLEEGLKYAATRSENKDSQFQEAREYQDLQICRVFGVPPHKVGIMGASPRANVEQENLSFVVDTIRPNCVRWEKNINMRLLTQEERDQGYGFRFSLDEMMRGDSASRFAYYQSGRQNGWLSANDVRRREGLNPIDGGDVYWQPINMIDARFATAYLLKAGSQSQDPNAGAAAPDDDAQDAVDPKTGEKVKGKKKKKKAAAAAPAPAGPMKVYAPILVQVDADTAEPGTKPVAPDLKPKPKELAIDEDSTIQKTY